jgi:hypothetical protein
MPLVKKNLTLAAGATSDQILVGTPYEYVGPNTRLVVAAAESTGTYSGNVVMNFKVNNTEFSSDVAVSEKVSGEAFGWNNTGYVLNDTITVGAERNRPVVTFTNNDAGSVDIEVAIFIGG